MKRYQDYEIEKARQLRIKEHYSFAQLQRITGIPATTIRNWCADDFVGTRHDTLLLTNERKREELKNSEKFIAASTIGLDVNTSKIYASILYWCEGTKYPASNKIEFTNSDPRLQIFFITLLRKAYNLDESKFRVHLQVHDSHDLGDIKMFWSKLLNIPLHQFIRPTITKMNGGKHRRKYYGTCNLRYNDFRIQLKLIGIYEEIGSNLEESHSGLVHRFTKPSSQKGS